VTGPRIFICDNYDSFTFNLAQYLGELGADLTVARNDEVTVDGVTASEPDGVVISPGPGTPSTAGISVDLVDWCARTGTPLFGVCLGLQAIGAAFGVPTVRAANVMHGKTSWVRHDASGVLRGLPSPMEVGRYHSLVLAADRMSGDLHITARTDDGVVMGARHDRLPIEGVQFHPESVLTPHGHRIVENFVDATRCRRRS
jgi:anthranilate synthase/aminodeoxychorismate synthase-like glutamine amidotransferase